MGCQKLTYQNFEVGKNYFRKELTSNKSVLNDCSTYQVNDHLGNIRAVISDIKQSDLDASNNPINFEPAIKVTNNYYAFGSLQPNRHFSDADGHRYGFQGQESDVEIKGEGNSVNYTFRMHDPRLGRFLSIDPLAGKYPFYTPYSFSGNRVIDMIELEGLEPTSPQYQWSGSNGYKNYGSYYGNGSTLSKVEGWWVYENMDSEGDAIHMYWEPKDGVWKGFSPAKPEALAPIVTEIAIVAISIPALAVGGAMLLPEVIIASEAIAIETAVVASPIIDAAAYTVATNPIAVGAATEFVGSYLLYEPVPSGVSSGSPIPALFGQTVGVIETFVNENKAKDFECIMCPNSVGNYSVPLDYPQTDQTRVSPVNIQPLNYKNSNIENVAPRDSGKKATIGQDY